MTWKFVENKKILLVGSVTHSENSLAQKIRLKSNSFISFRLLNNLLSYGNSWSVADHYWYKDLFSWGWTMDRPYFVLTVLNIKPKRFQRSTKGGILMTLNGIIYYNFFSSRFAFSLRILFSLYHRPGFLSS